MFPHQAQAERTDFDLREYLQVLRRRKWSLLAVVVVVVALAAVVSFRKTPVYESTATLLLRVQSIESLFSQAGSSSDPERRVDNEAELITGSATQDEVAERLGEHANVSVKAGGGTDVIEVTARSTDPDKAAEIANTYADAHSDVRQRENVAELRRAQEEVRLKLDELQLTVAEYDRAIADLERRLADPALDAGTRGDLQEELDDNNQARDSAVQNRAPFEERLAQLQIAEDLAASQPPLEVLTPAVAADDPVSPNHREDLTVALAVGVLLGIAFAFVREHLDDSVRDTDDVDRATGGLPQLGLIPKIRGLESGEAPLLVTATAPMSHAAEAYRALRTSVEFLGIENRIHTVHVTSAAASEGKTLTLVNLAAAFAQAGERVAVLDCDLRRPRLHEVFGLDREIGFTSVLLGGTAVEEALQPVPGFDHLDVMCSGTLPPNPAELLRSERLAEVVERLLDGHSMVLIDSPPVLPVTDALLVSRVADATLFVTASGISSKRRVRRAIESLQQIGAPLMGCVLNQAPSDVAYGYVDYSYAYYGNGHANGDRRRRAAKKAAAEKAAAEKQAAEEQGEARQEEPRA